MAEQSVRKVISPSSLTTGVILFVAVLFAAPAWAQHGHPSGRGAPAAPSRPMGPRTMPPMRTPPMRMPPMRTRPMRMPPMRRSPMPRPAPMPRTAPLPRPAAPSSRPVPRKGAPPSSPASPTPSTSSAPTPVQPRSVETTSGSSVPAPILFFSRMARRPAYTLTSPNSLQQKLWTTSAYNRYPPYLFSPFGSVYWGAGYWGGTFWNSYYGYPMFFGGLYCDPFDMWFCDPYSLFDSGFPLFASFGFNLNLFNMYLENPLLLDPWGVSFYSPFFPFSPFSSISPFSPSGTLFPFSPAVGGSISASDAASASSTYASSSTATPFGLALNSTSSANNGSGLDAGNPPPGQPVTLVFSDGTSVRATKYWLSNGELRYVTTAGISAVIPLAKLDMSTTMKVNERDGVHFLLSPSRPAPQSQKQ